MTAVSELRRYLWESGFTITDERYAVAAGKALRHPDRRVRRIFTVVSAATYDCLPGKGPPPHTRDAAGSGERLPLSRRPGEEPSAGRLSSRRPGNKPLAECSSTRRPGERGSVLPEFREAELVLVYRPVSRQDTPADARLSGLRPACLRGGRKNACTACTRPAAIRRTSCFCCAMRASGCKGL